MQHGTFAQRIRKGKLLLVTSKRCHTADGDDLAGWCILRALRISSSKQVEEGYGDVVDGRDLHRDQHRSY